MTEEQPGQFGIRLPDGLRIDRLPVGWAAGHWWISFIFSGVDFRAGRRLRSDRMFDEIPNLLRLEDDWGRITLPPSAGGDAGFDGDAYWVHYQFTDQLRRLTVSYMEDGTPIASENLELA